MEGVITRVSVTWAEDIGDGWQERVYTVVPDEEKISALSAWKNS